VAGIAADNQDRLLFRSTVRRPKQLTGNALTTKDVCNLVKGRLEDAGLPARLSPHSFRVPAITDLLTQGVPVDEGQPHCLLRTGLSRLSASRSADDVSACASFFNKSTRRQCPSLLQRCLLGPEPEPSRVSIP
jgi:hypothetical protein